MSSAFEIVPISALPGRPVPLPLAFPSLAPALPAHLEGGPVASPPTVRAVDEEADDDDDASEPEIVVPPAEPLETTSDFDEDDFDDDFDDDFEEEFEDDEFDSEVTPEDLEANDDTDSFDKD